MLEKQLFSLATLRVLVVDEVDFIFNSSKQASSLRKILTYSSCNNLQTVFSSASIPQHNRFLNEVVQHKWTKRDVIHIHVNPVEPMPSRLYHIFISEKSKKTGNAPSTSLVINFLKTSYHGSLNILLLEDDINFNSRAASMLEVKKGGGYLLVATDVASRGVDFPEMTHIYNFDLPKMPLIIFIEQGGLVENHFLMLTVLSQSIIISEEQFVLQRYENELRSLEDQGLNYVKLHAATVGIKSEKLESFRISIAKGSPMWETLDSCIKVVDAESLNTLIPRLAHLVRSGVGLNTRVGFANFITLLLESVGVDIKPYANILKFIEDTAALSAGNKSSQIACAFILRSYSSRATYVIGGYHAVIIPVVFLSRFEDDTNKSQATQKKQFRHHPALLWKLQDQQSIDELDKELSHSDGYILMYGSLLGDTNSSAVGRGNHTFLLNARIGGQQFHSVGSESTSGRSPLRQCSPSPSSMQSQYIEDSSPTLSPNIQVGDLPRSSQVKDLRGPLPSASFQSRYQQQARMTQQSILPPRQQLMPPIQFQPAQLQQLMSLQQQPNYLQRDMQSQASHKNTEKRTSES
ncbi:unnamed protein product [Vicia faba]|uniref:Helicase C-terminal domain-containing protein n=1 Tax=Vicia faba TaxID=3906 RepID=A0AAV0ZAP8_VICFA|nr:unnamed protein product [Vicia faba]